MRLLSLTLAGALLCITTAAQARPQEDNAARPEVAGPRRVVRPLDRQLVVAAPLDVGWETGPAARYIVTLGADLPRRDGTEVGACGVLALGKMGDRSLRTIELHVEPAAPTMPLDSSADLGTTAGEVTVHLFPPRPSWTKGFLNVDFQCDGSVSARYAVFVLIASGAHGAADSEEGAEAIEDISEPELEEETSSGCSSAPNGEPRLPLAITLAGITLLALRQRKDR